MIDVGNVNFMSTQNILNAKPWLLNVCIRLDAWETADWKGRKMNKASAILIINLVAEGIGVTKALMELAKRVKAGEEITQEDIKSARGEIDDAISDWADLFEVFTEQN